MIRAREFPRLESVSIEQVCPSRRQRRAARGLGAGIVGVGKLILGSTGFYVGVAGAMFGRAAFSATAPDLALVFGVGGIVCTVVCAVAIVRVAKAVPWLADKSSVRRPVLTWFICITGLVCAVALIWGFARSVVGGAP